MSNEQTVDALNDQIEELSAQIEAGDLAQDEVDEVMAQIRAALHERDELWGALDSDSFSDRYPMCLVLDDEFLAAFK